ncbi:MAG: hypothetical protein QOG30_199, partial [Acidimicrobiaceae bacterium]
MQAKGDLFVDHRAVIGGDTTLGIPETGEMVRGIADVGVDDIVSTVIAVRDDRLVLTRDVYRGNLYETEVLQITELNEHGLFTLGAIFDPDDLESAIALLDERWDLSLAVDLRAVRRLGARLWETQHNGDADGLRACFAPGATMRDHRQAAYGPLDVDTYVAAAMTVNDVVGSATQYREVAHVEPHGMAVRLRTIATDPTGNPFEWAMAAMFTVVDGMVTLAEGFEASDYDVAVARLEELRPSVLDNAATRSARSAVAAMARGEFEVVETAVADSFHFEDRRTVLQAEFEGRENLSDWWRLLAADGDFELEPIAIRGDSLALMRGSLRGDETDFVGGALVVNEVDSQGRGIANILFDFDDLDAAMVELDRRYDAGEGATD